MYAFLCGGKVEQADDRSRHIADDDARDKQHHRTPEQTRNQQQQAHDAKRSSHGGGNDQQITVKAEASQCNASAQIQHCQCYAQIGARVNAQYGRAGKRIAECRLQQKAAGAECGSATKGSDHLRNAVFQYDEFP